MFRSENYTNFQLDNETVSSRRQLHNKFKCQGKAEYTVYRKACSVYTWSELQITINYIKVMLSINPGMLPKTNIC